MASLTVLVRAWLLALQFVLLSADKPREMSLNGDNWVISDALGRVKNLQATVPGQVHLDLLRHKVIDDPYYGFNDQKLQWIAYDNWTYTLEFNPSGMLLPSINSPAVYLKCDGLDTAASISLNGQFVAYANNYHRRWLFDISRILKPGDANILQISFESSASYSVRKSKEYPYAVHGGGQYFPNAMRNFIRKPQSDFGWDWGPAFVPVGIWQNISIVSFDPLIITDFVPLPQYNVSANEWVIGGKVCVLGKYADAGYTLADVAFALEVKVSDNLTITGQGTLSYFAGDEECATLQSQPVSGDVIDPFLWWPYSSLHPSPQLFKATVIASAWNFTFNDTQEVDSASRMIGFRSIELVQEPPPNKEPGLLFYFAQKTAKGKFPIYAKGSNFIPMDAFVNRVTPDIAVGLLKSAVAGNQNMIRVWGGGLYQPDWFYGLCDKLGLMVWQEFMFADAQYPRDINFLKNVREEVKYQVKKLGHHPSIVLWSGNNENQAGGEANDNTLIDYSMLYDHTVRAALWEEDNSRPYWPSSPSNGALVDDMDLGLYIQRWGYSGDSTYGDLHRYDYKSYCTDVTKFPQPRFASEFGFQAYPSFYSLSLVSESGDWDNNSTFMNHRQHHPDGNQQLADMMALFFHSPNSTDKTVRFMDFIYLTQVIQAICISAEAEHYRRNLNTSGAYTRGTLYWQLNDIWQAQTWSSLEYSGRWKLLHYAMSKVYSELLVSAYQESGKVTVYIVSDQAGQRTECDLVVDTILWSTGKSIKTFKESKLQIEGFTGNQIWTKPITEVFPTSPAEGFLQMRVMTTDGRTLAQGHFFPSNFTQVQLKNPRISISSIQLTANSTFSFVLSSVAVAPYVMLDSGAIEGYFSDNGFLMIPNTNYTISFNPQKVTTVEEFNRNIRIRSIYDTYN